jgi:hypothetical protein
MMKRMFGLLTVLVLVVASAALGKISVDDKEPKNHTVEMHDNYFEPKENYHRRG